MEKTEPDKKTRRSEKKLKKAERQQQEQKKAMLNKLLTYGIGISIIVGIGWLVTSRRVPVPEGARGKSLEVATEYDHVKGSATASAVLIEYSDFQCPACKAYVPFVEQLTEELDDQLMVVYRNFPLKNIHLQAELAAQAAHAAGLQGKFWEMHDMLFQNQEDWSQNPRAKQLFEEYAESLALDMNQFKQDLSSKETKGWVKGDYLDGLSHGINSTPTFFLNGQKLDNPSSYEAFKQLILSVIPSDAASPSAQPVITQ